MPSDWITAILDPTAPLPAGWPVGAWGAFLLFLVPIGGGIPLGVLMARDAGVSPLVMAGMYFVSDIFMAVTHEPFFMLLGWLAGIIPMLGKVRDFFARSSRRAGLRNGGKRGPLGLILFSFTVDPISGRGAAAAAGHGFVSGWALAIAGDMIYFGVLMGATLWLSGMFGDERVTVGAVLILIWVISWLVQRRQNRSASQVPVAPRTDPSSPTTGGRAMPLMAAAAGQMRAVPAAQTVAGASTLARAGDTSAIGQAGGEGLLSTAGATTSPAEPPLGRGEAARRSTRPVVKKRKKSRGGR